MEVDWASTGQICGWRERKGWREVGNKRAQNTEPSYRLRLIRGWGPAPGSQVANSQCCPPNSINNRNARTINGSVAAPFLSRQACDRSTEQLPQSNSLLLRASKYLCVWKICRDSRVRLFSCASNFHLGDLPWRPKIYHGSRLDFMPLETLTTGLRVSSNYNSHVSASLLSKLVESRERVKVRGRHIIVRQSGARSRRR